MTIIHTKLIPHTPNCLFCGAPFEVHEIVAANGLRGDIFRSSLANYRLDFEGVFHWFVPNDTIQVD